MTRYIKMYLSLSIQDTTNAVVHALDKAWDRHEGLTVQEVEQVLIDYAGDRNWKIEVDRRGNGSMHITLR